MSLEEEFLARGVGVGGDAEEECDDNVEGDGDDDDDDTDDSEEEEGNENEDKGEAGEKGEKGSEKGVEEMKRR
ncbi:Hypothetical predicted protein [Octopus vulgaris]|uniref:Uncharacterized protein n=1 Tax=Octopus vulgaris TaxID=6645 RepID=A0AA36BE57_OCTVU|nr:Hypothetical predicted protein [Octopus vulgaris]